MLKKASVPRMLVVAVAFFVALGWLVTPSMAMAKGGSKSRGQGGVPAALKAIEEAVETLTGVSTSQHAELKAQLGAVADNQLALTLRLDSLAVACEAPPDLLPVPKDLSDFGLCRKDDNGDLVVRVKNQGGLPAGASTVRVNFKTPDGNPVTEVFTPALDPGEVTDVVIGTVALGVCLGTRPCEFEVNVDIFDVVGESDEFNNTATSSCPFIG